MVAGTYSVSKPILRFGQKENCLTLDDLYAIETMFYRCSGSGKWDLPQARHKKNQRRPDPGVRKKNYRRQDKKGTNVDPIQASAKRTTVGKTKKEPTSARSTLLTTMSGKELP